MPDVTTELPRPAIKLCDQIAADRARPDVAATTRSLRNEAAMRLWAGGHRPTCCACWKPSGARPCARPAQSMPQPVAWTG